MSVKKVNFRHMTHLRYPSKASKATKEWQNYTDTVDIPSLVLMENMDRTGAETVFMVFKDLKTVLDGSHRQRGTDDENGKVLINSKVAFVSMRNRLHQPLMPEPIKAKFQHLMTGKKGATNTKMTSWLIRV